MGRKVRSTAVDMSLLVHCDEVEKQTLNMHVAQAKGRPGLAGSTFLASQTACITTC